MYLQQKRRNNRQGEARLIVWYTCKLTIGDLTKAYNFASCIETLKPPYKQNVFNILGTGQEDGEEQTQLKMMKFLENKQFLLQLWPKDEQMFMVFYLHLKPHAGD